MNLDKLILYRRSKRKYLEKPINIEKIGEILDLSRYAASAGNLQNWKFIVVSDQQTKNQVSQACLEQYWMNAAPVFIVIVGDIDKATRMYGKKAESYTIQSCSNAATLMQLKAVDLGLATCWVGSFDEKAIQRILKLPERLKPIVILTLGYSGEESIKKKMNHLTNIVYFDRYGNKIKKITEDIFKSKLKSLKEKIFKKK